MLAKGLKEAPQGPPAVLRAARWYILLLLALQTVSPKSEKLAFLAGGRASLENKLRCLGLIPFWENKKNSHKI